MLVGCGRRGCREAGGILQDAGGSSFPRAPRQAAQRILCELSCRTKCGRMPRVSMGEKRSRFGSDRCHQYDERNADGRTSCRALEEFLETLIEQYLRKSVDSHLLKRIDPENRKHVLKLTACRLFRISLI